MELQSGIFIQLKLLCECAVDPDPKLNRTEMKINLSYSNRLPSKKKSNRTRESFFIMNNLKMYSAFDLYVGCLLK